MTSTLNKPRAEFTPLDLTKLRDTIHHLQLKKSQAEIEVYSQLNILLLQKKKIQEHRRDKFHKNTDLQDTILKYKQSKRKENRLREVFVEKANYLTHLDSIINQAGFHDQVRQTQFRSTIKRLHSPEMKKASRIKSSMRHHKKPNYRASSGGSNKKVKFNKGFRECVTAKAREIAPEEKIGWGKFENVGVGRSDFGGCDSVFFFFN
jgi:hypothetical protein